MAARQTAARGTINYQLLREDLRKHLPPPGRHGQLLGITTMSKAMGLSYSTLSLFMREENQVLKTESLMRVLRHIRQPLERYTGQQKGTVAYADDTLGSIRLALDNDTTLDKKDKESLFRIMSDVYDVFTGGKHAKSSANGKARRPTATRGNRG